MSIDNLPVILEKYFYPNQVVRAIPTHDKDGDKQNNSTHINRSIEVVDSENGKFALQLDIDLDVDKSINPPYEFQLTIVGIFRVTNLSVNQVEMRKQVFDIGTELLVGALRERVSMLTQSAPWGVFNLNVINISPISKKEVEELISSADKPAAPAKKARKKSATVKKKATSKK